MVMRFVHNKRRAELAEPGIGSMDAMANTPAGGVDEGDGDRQGANAALDPGAGIVLEQGLGRGFPLHCSKAFDEVLEVDVGHWSRGGQC